MSAEEFFQSHQWKLTVNLLSLVPYVIKGIPEAVALYDKAMDALKGGVSTEELQKIIDERNKLIDSILET